MDTIDYLILKFVDVNSKDNEGLTPLHYASKCDNELGVKRLLSEKDIRINVTNAGLFNKNLNN